MAIRERPAGITVLVVLQVIGAVLLLISSLGLLFLSAFIAGFLPSTIPSFVPGLVSGFFSLVAGFMVIMALIGFFIAWGLWTGKGWTWIIALILAILGVIGGLLTLPIGIVTIIIQGLIIYYLTRPHVKAFFGREAPQPPTPPAAGPI